DNSARINPLMQLDDMSEIKQLADAILMNSSVNNEEWITYAMPLLGAVFQAAKAIEEEPTIPKCAQMIINMDDSSLEKYIKRSNCIEAINNYSIYKQSVSSSGTSTGIRTVLSSSLQIFLDPSIKRILSGNDFMIS